MREIKFRCYSTSTKNWYHSDKEKNMTLKDLQEGKSGTWKVMQYTGLKDKNGKEIYEGDILKDDTDCWLEVKFGKLPFDKSGDCVCTFPSFYAKSYGKLGQAPCHECEHIGDWMKIIGNIYENPDWREL